jgi:hypothetical protein
MWLTSSNSVELELAVDICLLLGDVGGSINLRHVDDDVGVSLGTGKREREVVLTSPEDCSPSGTMLRKQDSRGGGLLWRVNGGWVLLSMIDWLMTARMNTRCYDDVLVWCGKRREEKRRSRTRVEDGDGVVLFVPATTYVCLGLGQRYPSLLLRNEISSFFLSCATGWEGVVANNSSWWATRLVFLLGSSSQLLLAFSDVHANFASKPFFPSLFKLRRQRRLSPAIFKEMHQAV